MNESGQLLRAYAERNDEEAFGELVRRHINVVYGAALRQTGGDTALAEDITQTVFTDLARKSKALSPEILLGGWLYRDSRSGGTGSYNNHCVAGGRSSNGKHLQLSTTYEHDQTKNRDQRGGRCGRSRWSCDRGAKQEPLASGDPKLASAEPGDGGAA